MTTKNKIISAYLVIGMLYSLYGWLFGAYSYRSLAYNLGRGLIWPAVMFPALGHLIGALVIVALVVLVVFFVR